MKRLMLVLSLLVIGSLLLTPASQVSADPGGNGGGHGNQGGNHGNQQGNQGNHGNSNGQADRPNQPPGSQEMRRMNYKGVIATADAAGMTLTLDDGSTQAFVFDAATVFKIPTLAGAGTAADLLPGMKVTVKAVDVAGVLTAMKVVVIPGQPMRVHRVGIVSAYTPGESISILARDGQEYIFTLATEVRILPPELADTLAVGCKVTIIAPRDVTQLEPVAVAIVIHPAQDETEEEPVN